MNQTGGENLSFWNNNSDPKAAVYIFTPAGFTTKLVLVLSMVIVGVVGFAGNISILYFVSCKTQLNLIEKSRFIKNFNLYIKSLALSDVLSTAISLPILCIQISLDIFQYKWPCRIARYLNIVFPVITIHNLIVISVEKYLSLRRVPKTLSSSTVRKLIFFAWFLGCLITLLPIATFRGIRYDLNETHFTIICKYDRKYLPFRAMFVIFTVIVYVLPCIFLAVINISLIRTVWITVKTRVAATLNNPVAKKLRDAKIRGTLLLVAVTFAFIIPYFFYLGYVTYNMVAKPNIDFQTDYFIRYGSGVIAYSNSAINFVIYVVKIKNFRVFLWKLLCGTASEDHIEIDFKRQNESAHDPIPLTILQPRSEVSLENAGRIMISKAGF